VAPRGGAPEACAPTELVSGACQPRTQQPLVETRCVQVRCSALMLVRKSAVCVRYLAPVPLDRSRAAGVHAQDVCFARQCLMPASVLAAQDDARTKHRRPGKAGQGDVCKFTPSRSEFEAVDTHRSHVAPTWPLASTEWQDSASPALPPGAPPVSEVRARCYCTVDRGGVARAHPACLGKTVQRGCQPVRPSRAAAAPDHWLLWHLSVEQSSVDRSVLILGLLLHNSFVVPPVQSVMLIL